MSTPAIQQALSALYLNDQFSSPTGVKSALASLCTALSLLPTFRASANASSLQPLREALQLLCGGRAWEAPGRATLLGFLLHGARAAAAAAASARAAALHILTSLLLLCPQAAAPHLAHLARLARFERGVGLLCATFQRGQRGGLRRAASTLDAGDATARPDPRAGANS